LSTSLHVESGRDLAAADEKSVLVGVGLAKSAGIAAGDVIVLLATTANGGPGAVEVTVAGIFVTSQKDYDDVALRLPIEVAKKLMKVRGETSWVVLLDQTERTAEAAAYLVKALPAKDFEVVPWNELADYYNKTVDLFSRQVGVVKLIIGLIIILTISNTQMMSVLERTAEIGTSLAIGQRRNTVLRMFVAEGALIGLIGGFLGVVVGYTAAETISAIGIPMPPAPNMTKSFLAGIMVGPQLIFDGLLLALLTTLIASIMPAWKASRMNIVDALRYNQ
jgi:putative ABC transport system permease protein